jgi:ATP-dependent Clp protease ATP-binding subunit ClpC
MATLHVRNVPEELYERLRHQAEANGRSIGAEAIQLLDERLGGGQRRGLLRRRASAPDERMSESARAVIASAQEEARGLGHTYIGTEHLLLGVLNYRPLPGLTLETARTRAEALVGRGEGAPADVDLPFTARAKKALDLSIREAHPGMVEPEHIVLGVLREGEGAGFQLMDAVAGDIRDARAALDQALETTLPASEFHVIELEGEAGEWEQQLNEAAAAGYELVSVVESRAVLRLNES